MERDRLWPRLDQLRSGGLWRCELCGFGVVAAAVNASHWITVHQPDEVMLLGIAGSLSSSVEVGTAMAFDSVVVDGIGVGSGHDFQSATAMGWSGDQPITLTTEAEPGNGRLVTVCAASSDFEMACQRAKRFTVDDAMNTEDKLAEDMEGYAVAAACQKSNVPLSIIRGISNMAGDRVDAHWKVDEAIDSIIEMIASRHA